MKMQFPYRRIMFQQGEKPGRVFRALILVLGALLAAGMGTQASAQAAMASSADSTLVLSEQGRMHNDRPIASMKIETEKEAIDADTGVVLKGTVSAFGASGKKISNDAIVTIEAVGGSIETPDLDSLTNGTQIAIHSGMGEFVFRPGPVPGCAAVTVTAGNVTASKEIDLNTPKEPFILVGLINGTTSSNTAGGDRSALADDTRFAHGLAAAGRAAFYARGTVYENYRLTASLDTDRRNRTKLFQEIDPDYLYSIYGDNSMLSYDAQTNRQFFAKLERNKSYMLLGDYNTALAETEFSRYSRSLNGVQLGHKDRRWDISAFGSLTDRRPVQKIIRGRGLSGYYDLGSTQITYGSEKIRIETRDRFHSEVVISTVERYRFTDYEIDYDQGTVFFKQPVPGVDEYGNPVTIVVIYEAQTNEASTYIAGGRATYQLHDNLSVGFTGAAEEQDPVNYMLLGTDVKYTLGSSVAVLGEYAYSQNGVLTGGPQNGQAYKLEAAVAPFTSLSLKGYYREIERGFYNISQSGGSSELGSTKYGAGGTFHPFGQTTLSADFYKAKQQTLTTPTTTNSVSAELEQKILPALSASVKIEDLRYEGTTFDTLKGVQEAHSTLGTVKMRYSFAERYALSVLHERNLGASTDITRPNGTSVLGEAKISDGVTLTGQETFYDGGGSLTMLGVTTTISENTSAYAKYEIGNAINGRRNMASIGLKNRLKISEDLTAHLGYERSKSLDQRLAETVTPDNSAYSVSLEYLPKLPVKATAKFEYGDDNLAVRKNYGLTGDYRFERDYSFLWKLIHSVEDARQTASYRHLSHLIMGFAYRPVEENWLNAVAKFEYKGDDNHYLEPFIDYGAYIFSAHAFIEPVRRFEMGVKYAFKAASENSDGFDATTHTSFYLVRAEVDVAARWSVGGEVRILHQLEAGDFLDGYSADVGFVVAKNLRVGIGYNFKGYAERDLIDHSLWSKGPFVSLAYKFGEDLLGY